MAIELYDAAKKIQKDDTTYYFVKHGSKNVSTYGSRLDKNFRREYPRGEYRDSDWYLVAYKKKASPAKMAQTSWNSPTGYIYGRIQFGNGYNIALYLDRQTATKWDEFDLEQQAGVIGVIGNGKQYQYAIELDNPEHQRKHNLSHEYCGKTYSLADYFTAYDGTIYWKLDNL